MASDSLPTQDSFKISPLIQLTLTSLYIALVIPLPFLAKATNAPVSPSLIWIGFVIGAIALWSGLSERVLIDEESIAVTYPALVRAFGRQGWTLRWDEITALKPRSTGQGGIVYYFLSQAQDRAYLLPMRVVGFARLVRHVEAKTSVDARDVKPLAQPWMYVILLGLTAVLLLVDIWTITTASSFTPVF
ncbi:hypothetical protein [cf. Phormidesmis sp. LEGE 11477]|uniref:hypothetical protein n=1 Tax=cf. Phormidesmis sp. LEGE 11477 TaxID=1828680 RepID=UPI00187E7E48|nr:hypothetical protein [cf. Phormidesmis sp. LEGE 11477]MBE9063143.1 hypothetical protein [cf. Phormidesmis sp. LEGE 11477]